MSLVQRLTTFLKLLGADVPQQQSRAGWVISNCPLGPWRHEGGKSGSPTFGIRRESGDPHVHCFSCGYSGTAVDLVYTIRHLNKTDPQIEVSWPHVMQIVDQFEDDFDLNLDSPDIEEVLFGAKKGVQEYPDWWLASFPKVADTMPGQAYCKARKLREPVWDALDLRFDPKENRVCFPVRSFEGKLVGLHGRAIDPDTQPRYRMYTYKGVNNPLFWLGESWVDLSKPIVVVEGPFDLASVIQVYPNVVSPLFANPSIEKLKRMADALEWVTFLDRGTGGDTGRKKIEAVLGADHMVTHVLPPENRKDPGECSVDELKDILGGVVSLVDLGGQ